MRRISAAILAVLVMTAWADAQTYSESFQPFAPKQPPKPRKGEVVNNTGSPTAGAQAGQEVLLSQLRGIVLVSDPKKLRPQGVKSGPSVDAGDIVLARQPDFYAAVQPYIGQPVSLKSLAELTRAIVSFFRGHDRPVVNVFVPDQNITSGYVQVVVVVSRVEKVEATGAKYFSNNLFRTEVSLRPGDEISGHALNEDVNWLNRNPFVQSDYLMSPGAAPGTTDLLLRTQDRFPLRVYTGYEDSGNQYTGHDRIFAGFNYGNLFGLGQQLSYQYTTGTDMSEFSAHSGTYIIPLPWRHQLTIFGSYANSFADLGPQLSTGGVYWQVSGRYEIPLPATEHFTESLILGFDFKRSNTDLIFDVVTVSNVYTDVDQFVAGYQFTGQDDYGSTSGGITGFWSPGGITGNDDDTDYMATRAGARDNYAYGQAILNRVTRLPYGFSWTVRGELQESDANLLPSEQLGLGGYATVRGYDEREANGDDGFLVSTEVATPPVSIAHLFGDQSIHDQLQFLGFVDYGGTSLHQATPADVNPNTNLLGVGPGMRYVINPYVSIRFDYGFQMIPSDVPDTGFDSHRRSRAHIGVVVSY